MNTVHTKRHNPLMSARISVATAEEVCNVDVTDLVSASNNAHSSDAERCKLQSKPIAGCSSSKPAQPIAGCNSSKPAQCFDAEHEKFICCVCNCRFGVQGIDWFLCTRCQFWACEECFAANVCANCVD